MAVCRTDSMNRAWKKRHHATIEEYMKTRYIELEKEDCWIAPSAKPPRYCACEYKGIKFLLHRKMYECYIGEIPEGMIIRHKCDNTACVNPEHLEIGTKKDNRQDFMKRHPRADELISVAMEHRNKARDKFWSDMTPEQKDIFVKSRAEKQRIKRLDRLKNDS